MTGSVRLLAQVAVRDRGMLAPVLALLLALLGTFAHGPNDVAATWAFTALLCMPITAWLRIAIARAEPDAQRLVRVAAAGSSRSRRGDGAAGTLLGAATALAFIVWPLATGAFDRPVGFADLAAATIAHAACAAAGSALGRLAAPPVTARAATALGIVLIATLTTIAMSKALGALAGPGALAVALADASPHTVPIAMLPAVAGALAWAAAAIGTARFIEQRRG